MELNEFLTYLKVSRHSGSEYMCRCPAHDDKQASLSVSAGEKGIVLNCHAGCSAQSIVDRLGLKMRDLFYTQAAAPARRSAPRPKPVPPSPVVDEVKPDVLHPDVVYDYRDANGVLIFQQCRIEHDVNGNAIKKTFRLRKPDGKGGWTWKGIGKELWNGIIYRMPEVMAAIRDGQSIWIVEGEKDVQTLESLGLAATCNPCGASIEDINPAKCKWTDEHSKALAGADVVVLCDNDDAGHVHGWAVATSVSNVARRVRLVEDLTQVCPELQAKDDVTDMVQIMGATRAKGILERLAAHTNAFDPNGVPTWMSFDQRMAMYYERAGGYTVRDGGITMVTTVNNEPSYKRLCNFCVIPNAVVERDNGVDEPMREYRLEGWNAHGEHLPSITIPASEFDGMGWVSKHWDFRANIEPGSTVKDRLRHAISSVGYQTAKRWTEYVHTGWRKIGGQWCYLFHGGAIGRDDVTVRMDSGLDAYRLDGNGEKEYETISVRAGAVASLGMLNVMEHEIAIPLLGCAYLAPLREWLTKSGTVPGFALFLLGGSGVRKSTAAALALSHFGDFNAKNLPASFNDTANAIRKKAFLVKDALFVVDDYHPVSSLQERKKMEDTAQSLARAFGDGAERGRMNADSTIRKSNPPRCIAIISGEDTPNLGESGVARFYIANVGKNDVPRTKGLTELQELARKGYLQKSMTGYIKWLIGQLDTLGEELHERFLRNRERAMEALEGQHGRSAEAVANIMIGIEYMFRYMASVGAIEPEAVEESIEVCWDTITESSRKQNREYRSERPTQLYLDSLSEMLSNGRCRVRDLRTVSSETNTRGELIGFMNGEYYYFIPKIAFALVSRLLSEQGGRPFPLSEKGLYKQMQEDGILLPGNMSKGSSTKLIKVDGKPVRALWIERKYIDGDDGEQISFEELNAGETPFEDKGHEDV